MHGCFVFVGSGSIPLLSQSFFSLCCKQRLYLRIFSSGKICVEPTPTRTKTQFSLLFNRKIPKFHFTLICLSLFIDILYLHNELVKFSVYVCFSPYKLRLISKFAKNTKNIIITLTYLLPQPCKKRCPSHISKYYCKTKSK